MGPTTDFVPARADRVVISVNPKAGSRSAQYRVERTMGLLAQQKLRVEAYTELTEAAERANYWHAVGKLRALVGAGGDGTAAELVNRTAPGVPITMLPTGTGNLLAGYLKLGDTPEDVCRIVTQGTTVHLDAGSACGRVFLLMASCGFDADVVRRVHTGRRGHAQYLSYFTPILASIGSYEFPEIRVYWVDGDTGAGKGLAPPVAARWVLAFNLPCYGAALRVVPQADGTDGMFDLCTFRHGSFWHGLWYASAVYLGWHQRLADCAIRRTRRIRITSDQPVPYQLDGDPAGYLPLDLEVIPKRLTLLVPRSKAR